MRNRVFLVYLFIIVLGIGCSVSNGKDANIALPTMMCGMCETNIKSAVADLDGVMKVTIDLEKKYGKEYLPKSPRMYKGKSKNAQEAHEAIRPAGSSFKDPSDLKTK